jgi:2-amino-4-hydroxy-6-hydroxymethyldihydropteridine diphosphokinase
MPTVYIGIGANLGDRERTIRDALALLAADSDLEIEAVSTIRETDPVGFVDQPRFLNAAARLQTELPPHALLERLLAVEQRLGRVRGGERYGPRTIDLDLLLYGDEVVDEPALRVPHPGLAERRFVLEPLAELDPGLAVPGLGQVETLLAKLECGH